jgi:hypothetical protein
MNHNIFHYVNLEIIAKFTQQKMSEPLPDTVPSPSEVRKYKLDMLHIIPLPLNCTGWDRAFEFLLDKFNLVNLTKFFVRTFDYIPQDVRPDEREVYFSVLSLIDQVPYGDDSLQHSQALDHTECRRHLLYLLHSLRLALPALLLTYDARLGSLSRLAKIKTNCKFFLWQA